MSARRKTARKVAPKTTIPKSAPPAVSRPFAALGKPPEKATKKPKAVRVERVQPPPRPKPAPATKESEDALAFEMHMRGVQPLGKKAHRIPATASSIDPSTRGPARRAERGETPLDLDADARNDLAALVSSGLRFEVVDDGGLIEGRRLEVDPRELRRLRKQSYAIDGRLDLHGQTASGAKESLERFVERRRSQGDRAVLVVHGKGLHSPRGAPVLRGEIGAWLSQGRAAKDVLAFASIDDGDGSSGALMILLAKR